MDILKSFGQKLRNYRHMKGLSQEGLAELSGLHRTYIGAIERGERNVSLRNIKRLSVALGISLAELLRDI